MKTQLKNLVEEAFENRSKRTKFTKLTQKFYDLMPPIVIKIHKLNVEARNVYWLYFMDYANKSTIGTIGDGIKLRIFADYLEKSCYIIDKLLTGQLDDIRDYEIDMIVWIHDYIAENTYFFKYFNEKAEIALKENYIDKIFTSVTNGITEYYFSDFHDGILIHQKIDKFDDFSDYLATPSF